MDDKLGNTQVYELGANDGTQALRRGLHILALLRSVLPDGLGATEIASRTGIQRPTVHRMLAALEESGWIRKGPDGKRYLAAGAMGYGPQAPSPYSHLISNDLLNRAAMAMRRLANHFGDAVYLVVREGNDSVGVHREIGHYPVQILGTYPGKRHPLGVGAPSMALLAALPDDEARRAVEANIPRLKDYTGITADLIWKFRENSKNRGYTVMTNYAVHRTTGVACTPETALPGIPLFALGVGSVTERMLVPRQAEIAGMLKAELEALVSG